MERVIPVSCSESATTGSTAQGKLHVSRLCSAFCILCYLTAPRALNQRDLAVQVLVIGKLSQAVVVAAAAYRDQSGFQQLTGIERTQMVEDSGSWDTQVHRLHLRIHPVCFIAPARVKVCLMALTLPAPCLCVAGFEVGLVMPHILASVRHAACVPLQAACAAHEDEGLHRVVQNIWQA